MLASANFLLYLNPSLQGHAWYLRLHKPSGLDRPSAVSLRVPEDLQESGWFDSDCYLLNRFLIDFFFRQVLCTICAVSTL